MFMHIKNAKNNLALEYKNENNVSFEIGCVEYSVFRLPVKIIKNYCFYFKFVLNDENVRFT